MDRKKVYVSGYFKGNFGDDIFLKILIERYPAVNFFVMAEKSKYRDWNANLKIFNLENRIYNKVFNIFKRYKINLNRIVETLLYHWCNEAIKIGGSLFMENIATSEKLAEDYNDKKYFIVGANVGPIYSEKYKQEVQRIFEKSKDVCLRDLKSYQMFQSVNTVRYAPDIAFQLDVSHFENKKEKSIFISVINLEKRNFSETEKQYYNNLIKYIITTYHDKGYAVKVASFCEREGDAKYIRELLQCYLYLESVFYDGNIDKIICSMNNSEIIFATRFHAMIIGFLLHKKTVPIVYSDKMLTVMKDIGYKNDYYDIRKTERDEELNINDYVEVDISEAVKTSETHFSKIDKVLGY